MPSLQARFGAKPLIVSGFALLAAGLGGLALVRPDGSYGLDVLPASLVAAAGMALAFVPSLGTAIGAAPMAETGSAAGLVNTSYQIGSAVGLAALTAVAAGVTAGGTDVAVLTGGYSAAFLGAAVIAALGLLAPAAFLRTARAPQTEQARETVDA